MSEETGPVGVLVAVGVCAVGVVGLAMAIGAVVPAVGDAMSVKSTGIGGMFGYLFGAVLFGSPSVLGLRALRRHRTAERVLAAQPRDEQAALAGRPIVPLPDGLGLTARWLVAVPLMLLSVSLPYVGQKVLTAWRWVSSDERPLDFGQSGRTFTGEFWAALSENWQLAALPVLVMAGFLVRRTAFGAWPSACRYTALIILVPAILISLSLEKPAVWLRDAAVAAVLIWLSYSLARLTLHVLTRPVACDVVRSTLEILFPLPGQRPRLRLKHDRLVLDRLHQYPWLSWFDDGPNRLVLPWREVRDAQLDEQHDDRSWVPIEGQSRTVAVPAGPAVRITGGDGTWLVPTDTELTAHTIVAVIKNRAG